MCHFKGTPSSCNCIPDYSKCILAYCKIAYLECVNCSYDTFWCCTYDCSIYNIYFISCLYNACLIWLLYVIYTSINWTLIIFKYSETVFVFVPEDKASNNRAVSWCKYHTKVLLKEIINFSTINVLLFING